MKLEEEKKYPTKNLKVSDRVHRKIKQFAADADLKIQDFVENAIEKYFENNNRQD